MSLLQIVLRSLRQHMLSTVITAFSIALANGLLMSVWVVKDQARKNFTGVDSGFDGVFGARGSKLQLVLNSIFHLEASPGNLSWEQYGLIAADRRVASAVPIAVGDNYRGYRLVGDVDFEAVCEVAGAITPVPGGIAPMTLVMLLANTVRCARRLAVD